MTRHRVLFLQLTLWPISQSNVKVRLVYRYVLNDKYFACRHLLFKMLGIVSIITICQ